MVIILIIAIVLTLMNSNRAAPGLRHRLRARPVRPPSSARSGGVHGLGGGGSRQSAGFEYV